MRQVKARRKFLSTGVLFMFLLIALGALAVGYGLWSKTLFISGTVNTGNVNAEFVTAFTDDDNVVDNAAKDAGDTGDCPLPEGSMTSCDPKEPGPNPARYDKDVGGCVVTIDPDDPQIFHVEVSNGYPSYWCTVWYDIENKGSIPVKIQQLQLTPNNFTNGDQVTVSLSQVACGAQIDPEDTQQGDIRIHVEQAAVQGGSYSFTGSLKLVQWNEHDPSQCIKLPLSWQTCSAGEGACTQDPEVVIDPSADDTITAGIVGVPEGNQQPTSVHGASAVLPVGAASYSVHLTYEFCTWDSYNPATVQGTGYWDAFSVSVSQDAPYWNLGLSDPIANIAGVIDYGYSDGGALFGDGTLEGASCGSPVTTTLTMTGDPSKTNYLNVVVDTASLPDANHNFPSWAIVSVDSVTIP